MQAFFLPGKFCIIRPVCKHSFSIKDSSGVVLHQLIRSVSSICSPPLEGYSQQTEEAPRKHSIALQVSEATRVWFAFGLIAMATSTV